jgi:hypothetical protein
VIRSQAVLLAIGINWDGRRRPSMSRAKARRPRGGHRRSSVGFAFARPQAERETTTITNDRMTLLELIEKGTDAHLVEQYAQAIGLARRATQELAERGPVVERRTSPWVAVLAKAHRSSVALAARLRLSPQHRADSSSAGRKGGCDDAISLRPYERRKWLSCRTTWNPTS